MPFPLQINTIVQDSRQLRELLLSLEPNLSLDDRAAIIREWRKRIFDWWPPVRDAEAE